MSLFQKCCKTRFHIYLGTQSTAVVRFALLLLLLGIVGLLAGCERRERPLQAPSNFSVTTDSLSDSLPNMPIAQPNTYAGNRNCYEQIAWHDSGLHIPPCAENYLLQAWDIAERFGRNAIQSENPHYQNGYQHPDSFSNHHLFNAIVWRKKYSGYDSPLLVQYASTPIKSKLRVSRFVENSCINIGEFEFKWKNAYHSLTDVIALDLNTDGYKDFLLIGGNISCSRSMRQYHWVVYQPDSGKFKAVDIVPRFMTRPYRREGTGEIINDGDGGNFSHWWEFFNWVDATELKHNRLISWQINHTGTNQIWTAYRIHPNGDTTHVGRDSINAWLSELQYYTPLPGAMAW